MSPKQCIQNGKFMGGRSTLKTAETVESDFREEK